MTSASKFWMLFVASLAIAIASAGVPYLTNRNAVPLIMRLVAPFCLLVVALRQFRWRGLWFLLGAPLAFWWPILFAGMASACAHNIRSCP